MKMSTRKRHDTASTDWLRTAIVPELWEYYEKNWASGGPQELPLLLGISPAWADAIRDVIRAASTTNTVFLGGAAGVGKTTIASLIHQLSPVSDEGEFVTVNIAERNDSLLDSELFGHAKGAFTGANTKKDGYITQAEAGTLFIDELGDVSKACQAKLLRCLEEGTYRPVGGNKDLSVSCRFVLASLRDPSEDLQRSEHHRVFRADLLSRITTYIKIPSLDERTEDIPLLIRYFAMLEEVEVSAAAIDMFIKTLPREGDVRTMRHAFTNAAQLAKARTRKASPKVNVRDAEEAIRKNPLYPSTLHLVSGTQSADPTAQVLTQGILQLQKKTRWWTARQLAEHTSQSVRNVRRHLNAWRNEGTLISYGERRAKRYHILKAPPSDRKHEYCLFASYLSALNQQPWGLNEFLQHAPAKWSSERTFRRVLKACRFQPGFQKVGVRNSIYAFF